jgi:hypothetical protein
MRTVLLVAVTVAALALATAPAAASPVFFCHNGHCVWLHVSPPPCSVPPPPREPLRAEPREEEAKTAVPAPNPVAQGLPDRFHACGVTGVTIRLPALVGGEIVRREQYFIVFSWQGWAKEVSREDYARWHAWHQRVDRVTCGYRFIDPPREHLVGQ